jgi:DNA-binding transcriptional ArsR family regulator
MAKKDKDKGGDRAGAWAEALEGRLARLEAAFAAAGGALPDPPEAGPEGRIRLGVRTEGVEWRHEVGAAALLHADWPALAPRLAALGHPVRLAILRAVLGGTGEASALQQAAGAATAGQFYHHLRELTAAGWLVPQKRGVYALPAGRAGALLAAVALALA